MSGPVFTQIYDINNTFADFFKKKNFEEGGSMGEVSQRTIQLGGEMSGPVFTQLWFF